jgi:hypothetical protein
MKKSMTVLECEKYIRDSVRDLGLTFRRSESKTKCGKSLYIFTKRFDSKAIIITESTLSESLENLESGYIAKTAKHYL